MLSARYDRSLVRRFALVAIAILVQVSAGCTASTPEYFPAPQVLPLALAVERGDVDAIQSLIRGGVTANALDREGGNLLDWALRHNERESFLILLESGADPNLIKPSSRTTIVHRVALNSDASWLRMALDAGGDPNIEEGLQRTALFTAISSRGDCEYRSSLERRC